MTRFIAGKTETVNVRMRMLIGSKRKTHCRVNSAEAARKKRTRNLYLLQDAGTASFRRAFRNTVASVASITAPSGQTHPQKKRPSTTVRSATTSAGQTSPMSARPARVAAPAIRGSSRRNRLTAYGRTSLSLYSVLRNRNTKRRKIVHCETRRSVRVVLNREPPASSRPEAPCSHCTNGMISWYESRDGRNTPAHTGRHSGVPGGEVDRGACPLAPGTIPPRRSRRERRVRGQYRGRREGGGRDRPRPAVQPRDRGRGADGIPVRAGSRLRHRRADRRGRAARGRGHPQGAGADPGRAGGRGDRLPVPRGGGVPGQHPPDLRHPVLPPPRQLDHRVPRDRPDLGLLRDQPAADRVLLAPLPVRLPGGGCLYPDAPPEKSGGRSSGADVR